LQLLGCVNLQNAVLSPSQKLRELFAEQQLNGKGKSGGAGLRRRLTRGAKVGGGDVQDSETDEDKPLMLIQDCMRAANVRLADGIEELMKREEERLRHEIKEVRGVMQLTAHPSTQIVAHLRPALITAHLYAGRRIIAPASHSRNCISSTVLLAGA